jgi:hypothetical protein
MIIEPFPHVVGGAHSQAAPTLPDPNLCLTRPIGSIKSFAACLKTSPRGCPYLRSFGEVRFCEHKHWEQFVQQPKDKIEKRN